VKAIVSPLVMWIWVGGIVMGLGVIFGLWPRRRTPEGADAAPTPGARADREVVVGAGGGA
jgi:cytochrome c biogenesis factor